MKGGGVGVFSRRRLGTESIPLSSPSYTALKSPSLFYFHHRLRKASVLVHARRPCDSASPFAFLDSGPSLAAGRLHFTSDFWFCPDLLPHFISTDIDGREYLSPVVVRYELWGSGYAMSWDSSSHFVRPQVSPLFFFFFQTQLDIESC